MSFNQFRLWHRLAWVILALSISASASWKEKVLYSFQGASDGSTPAGGVVFDKLGNLYGATTDGGAADCLSLFECGTVFQLSPPVKQGDPWTETVLYIFKGGAGSDGASPFSGLIIDAAGNLYGSTGYGGTGTCIVLGTNVGCGTVYELSPPAQKGGAWTEKVLYSFRGDKDGQLPYQDLVFDKAGNLYGATIYGGGYGSCNAPSYKHCGTVFRLSPPKTRGGKWTEKVLYSFKGGIDGASPNGGLVLDGKSTIYGTTLFGGNQGCKADSGNGCGTVFQLLPAKVGAVWTEKVLHRFRDATDGAAPVAGLTLAQNRDLYGTTAGGGSGNGLGVVFRLRQAKQSGGWSETVLYSFQGSTDGRNPWAPATFDGAGNLYTTTNAGGTYFDGTLVRLGPPERHGKTWRFMLLYTFAGSPDAEFPAARLILDRAGNFYSTTQNGGTGQACQGGCGTVFKASSK